MNLTPLDVRRKEFDKAFRGYDPTEVDLFLKQVADRLEDVQEEARRTEERTREAEAKLVHYEKVELALQEALESARESARRSEASAEEKARLIVQEAELRAEKIVHDAERERYGLRQDVSKLNARQAEIAARLRGFLFSELEVLAQFQGDDPVGFIKLQPAGGGPGPQGALPPPPARLEAPISDMRDAPDEGPEPDDAGWSSEASDGPPASAASAPEPAALRPEPSPAPPEPEPQAAPPEFAPVASPAEPSRPEPAPASAPSPETSADAHAPAEASPRPAEPPPEPPPSRPTPPAVTGGWDLRSLVTGEERGATGSDEEREAIKRILDDLD